jgi:nitrogen fixation protein FixH
MKPPFNPWPFGILLAFALFIAGTATLVVIASAHRSDLVRTDYYDHEVRHQQHMDKVARTLAAAPDTRVTYDAPRNLILLTLPKAHALHAPQGDIHFYRPSAANLDRHFRLDIDDSGQQHLDAGDLSSGLWQVRISWSVGSEEFFHSQKLVLHRN